MHPVRVVEPAHGGQEVPATLAAEQVFPVAGAHACELETSLYLTLDGENVRNDRIKSDVISFNEEESPFNWVDLCRGSGDAGFLDQQLQ